MKLIVLYITNNATVYGGAQPLRQAVLFVFVPVDNYTYDGAGRLMSETKNGALQANYTYDNANNVQKTGLTYTNGRLTAVNGAAIIYDALGPCRFFHREFAATK